MPYRPVWFYLRTRENEIRNYFFKRSKGRKLITKLKFLNFYLSNLIVKSTWVFPSLSNDLDGEQLIFHLSAFDRDTWLRHSFWLFPDIPQIIFKKLIQFFDEKVPYETAIKWTNFGLSSVFTTTMLASKMTQQQQLNIFNVFLLC